MEELEPEAHMKTAPAISVIMSVHNGEEFLAEAVESILGQTFGNFEFIIINDGSSDRSGEILEGFAKKDGRIKLIEQENLGLTKSLNKGLNRAKGKYIARMDADDIALPERFAQQTAYLDAHPECVALGSKILFIDPFGLPLWESKHELSHDGIDAQLLTGSGSAISHPAVTIRGDALKAVGGYREHLDTAQDLDLFLRLAEYGKVANLGQILLKYRLHLSSVNYSKRQRQRFNTEVILKDAYARRSLNYPEDMTLYDWHPIDPSDQYYRWAWNALHLKEKAIARKYAFAALKIKPASLDIWRLVYCTIRGY